MCKIPIFRKKIESSTATLAEQIASTVNKTRELENAVSSNKTSIEELNKDYLALKSKVEAHDSSLAKLQSLEEDISNSTDQTINCMNKLIDTQREQIDSFNEGAKQLQKKWKKEVLEEVNQKFKELEKERQFHSLKKQAFKNKLNLVIIGLPEDAEKSTSQLVKSFFTENLKVQNIKFNSTYRLGSQPQGDNNYNRPVLIKFSNWMDRSLIWKKMSKIATEEGKKKIRIQTDLLKILREGLPMLYKVVNAASKIQEFANAKIHDY